MLSWEKAGGRNGLIRLCHDPEEERECSLFKEIPLVPFSSILLCRIITAILTVLLLFSAVLLVVHLRWNVSPWSLFKKCISEHHKMHMQYKTRGENVLHHTDFQKQHILGCYSLHFLSLIFGSCSIFSQRCFCFLRSIPTTPANVFPTTFLKEVLWGFPY